MGTIKNLLTKFESLDTDAICEKAVLESGEVMAELNAEQINTGLKADGTEMPDYSFRSVFQYGKQPGPIRLRDTGAWQAGITVTVQGGIVSFNSIDEKDKMLTDRYGETIHGLSDKYADEARREAIQPNFNKEIEAATGLSMT